MKTKILIVLLAMYGVVNAQNITANFSGCDSGCAPICINFTDLSTSSNGPIIAWQWAFSGGTPSTSTSQTPQNICYFTPGVHNVQLIVTNSNGDKDTATLTGCVETYSRPAVNAGPSVTVSAGSSTTLNATGGGTYIWNPGGATASSIVVSPNVTSAYCVRVEDANGCWDTTCVTVYVGVLGVQSFSSGELASVYPIPFTSNTTFTFNVEQKNVQLKLFSLLGKEVRSLNFSGKEFILERGALSNGTYFYQITSLSAGVIITGKLIIQ